MVPAKRYVVCTPTTVRTPSTLVQPLPSRSTSASSVASWVRNRRPGDGSSSRGGFDRRDRMTGWHVVKIVRRRRQLRALVWPPAVYGASPWESVGDSSPFAVEGSLFDSGLRPDDHGGWVGRGVGRRPLSPSFACLLVLVPSLPKRAVWGRSQHLSEEHRIRVAVENAQPRAGRRCEVERKTGVAAVTGSRASGSPTPAKTRRPARGTGHAARSPQSQAPSAHGRN